MLVVSAARLTLAKVSSPQADYLLMRAIIEFLVSKSRHQRYLDHYVAVY